MASFAFKCLGRAVPAEELPKLPLEAQFRILDLLEHYGLTQGASEDAPAYARFAAALAYEMVALSLRRLDPKVTADTLRNDEDHDVILDAFTVVRDGNPRLFPKTGGGQGN